MSRFGNKRKVEMQGKFGHLHGHVEMSGADVKIAERVIKSHLHRGDGVKRLPAQRESCN